MLFEASVMLILVVVFDLSSWLCLHVCLSSVFMLLAFGAVQTNQPLMVTDGGF